MATLRLLLSLLIVVLSFASASFAEVKSTEKIKVGIVLPLSGEAASVGEAIRNGITLGFEGLDSETKGKLDLVFEDDALLPKNTISALNKLINSDHVDVLVTAGSGPSNVAAPIAEQHQIPLLAIATDPKVVENRRYVVNFWVTPEEQARVVIPEALRRGYKRVARIATQNDFALSIKKIFDQANQGRIEIIQDEEYPSDHKDFKTYLTKLRSQKNIDAVFVLLYSGQAGVFAKQARQMGVSLPLFAYETFEDNQEVKVSEGALLGQWYVNADDPSPEFLRKYNQRFPQASLYGAGNGHDIIQVIGSAVSKSFDRDKLNYFFHTLHDFRGALGTYSASNDNRFSLPAAVKEVTINGFRRLS